MAKTKKNTKENFKETSKDDIKKSLAVLEENLRVIHFKAEGSRSKNVKEVSALKKQIARAKTELNSNKK